MEMNKSSELVNASQTALETEPPGAIATNPIEKLVEAAEEAVRLGNVQESREHLTRIFELLAGSSASRMSIHSDSPYQLEAFQMQRSA